MDHHRINAQHWSFKQSNKVTLWLLELIVAAKKNETILKLKKHYFQCDIVILRVPRIKIHLQNSINFLIHFGKRRHAQKMCNLHPNDKRMFLGWKTLHFNNYKDNSNIITIMSRHTIVANGNNFFTRSCKFKRASVR